MNKRAQAKKRVQVKNRMPSEGESPNLKKRDGGRKKKPGEE